MKNSFNWVSFLDFGEIKGLTNKARFITTAMMINLMDFGIKILRIWPEPNMFQKEGGKDVCEYSIISLNDESINSKKIVVSFFETDNGIATNIIMYKWDESSSDWMAFNKVPLMFMLIEELENDFPKIIAKMR